MTTEWHLDPRLAGEYAAGRLGRVPAASVEQHLLACADCRALLVPAVDTARLDTVLTAVLERVESPRPTHLERLMLRLGIDASTSRLVAATPSLRSAWFTGVVLVLALALVAAHSGSHGIALFLALAPVLPVVGVALAFGPSVDPTHELAVAAPFSSVRLLAARALAVVGSTVLLATAAAAFLPGSPWLAVAWLLPALALTAGTLALSTRFDTAQAAAALSLLWVATIIPGLAHTRDPLLASRSAVQLASLAALAAAGAVLVARRDSIAEILRRTS